LALQEEASVMRGIRTVDLVAKSLKDLSFPALSRPDVKPNDAPTEELIRWGTKVYAYSLVAHLRKMLEGLIQLASAERTAHACYVTHTVENYILRHEWGPAWKVLSQVATGTLWIKRHASKYGPSFGQTPDMEFPDPVRIRKIIDAYKEYLIKRHGNEIPNDDYSFLSELSHPNAICLQQYHIYRSNSQLLEIVGEVDPLNSPLPIVNWCLIDILIFINTLLGLGGDATVQPRIREVVEEIVRRAPGRRQ
jgi:hypothetical protein